MEFKKHVLENGLTIIGEVQKQSPSASVGFFVRTGARDETMDINGVSHFLEHMMFKGTDKLSAFEVNESFDKTGAEFNAFTSEENTVYYAKVLPEYLLEITDLWSQLMRPALRDDDFNMEKNVIKEEIAMYEDLPQFDVMEKCRTLYFGDHPCGQSVLGTTESIDALQAEQMREYFNRRYAPNNLVLACAGNFDWDAFVALAEKNCASWQPAQVGRELSHKQAKPTQQRIVKENLVKEHICLIHEGVAAQDPRRFAASLLATIIGDNTGSRFFWELVDKALVDEASIHFSAMDGTGLYYTYVNCNPEKREQVMEITQRILSDVCKDGITEKELEKARNKILSAMVLKNEQTMGRLIDLGGNWVYLNEYRAIDQDVQDVKAVQANDILQLANELQLQNFAEYALTPAK